MHPINFVFDVDDTLVLHFEKSEWKRETKEIVKLYGEDFLQKHIFLDLSVKVLKDWRNSELPMKKFGYDYGD